MDAGGMVDVSGKPVIPRRAVACGRIILRDESMKALREGTVEKGDPLEASKIAAIMAVKRAHEILPYCHPLPIDSVKVSHEIGDRYVRVCVEVKTSAKTGVEMEALVGVSVALLNIWDMLKKYEKDERGQYPGTLIEGIRVIVKEKGSSSGVH